jgi:H/ACA ribonucleoprotein complex subunit 2
MGKEKDSTLSKDERKALRQAEKEKKTKRSDSDGVHKSKDIKKDKSKTKKERVALAEKVANAVENGTAVVVGEKKGERDDEEMVLAEKSDAEDDGKKGQEDKKASPMRPVGALVPFANPLADEKVAKKVFKSVKKGESTLQTQTTIIIINPIWPLPLPQKIH